MLTRSLLCLPSVFSSISSSCGRFEKGRGASSDGELYQLIADASFNVPSALHASPLGLVRSWLLATSSVSFAINFRSIPFYWHVKQAELLTFLTLSAVSLHLAHSCRVIKAAQTFRWLWNARYAHNECRIGFVSFTTGWHGWQGD